MGSHRPYRARKYEVGQRLLLLRTRAKLTQVELTALARVNRRSLQNWEAGAAYPKENSLQQLIAIFLERGAFELGQEQEEAEKLWEQVNQDAPRHLAPFDVAWFTKLLAGHQAISQGKSVTQREDQAIPTLPSPLQSSIIDWGEAIDVPVLYGREAELSTLQQWVLVDRCRVVALLGLGGIGKTSLVIAFAQQMAPQFDAVFFRSLRNAPPLGPLLDDLILAVSAQQAIPPESVPNKIALLIQLLRERRCLLVLDNLEAIIQAGAHVGIYRAGYDGYGLVIQRLGEATHQGCMLLTSREKPAELGPLEGQTGLVRTFLVRGLADPACQAILGEKEVVGAATEYAALTRMYGGNPLALKLVSEPIRELFGGKVGAFLESGDAFFNGVGELLEQQYRRLAALEQTILYWLAIERELTSLETLLLDMTGVVPQREVLQALESLRRRLLIERGAGEAAFTLQPVIMEYLTDRLIGEVSNEILSARPRLLNSHALVQATAKDYVRHSQERLIALPLLERLTGVAGDANVAERLQGLLEACRGRSHNEQGYGPGNVVNLLRLLRGNLRGLDLSNLAIWQAYLQEVEAQDMRLNGAYLAQSVLGEAFEYSTCIALSADGAYLASSTQRGEVRLWRVADRMPIMSVQAHTGETDGLAIAADGRMLVSGAIDGTAKVWAAPSGQLMMTLQGHSGGVYCVALSADEQLLASGGADGTVRLWDMSSGICLAVLEGHTSAVWEVAFASERQLLASSSIDGTIRLWQVPGGQLLATLQGHDGPVWGIALRADGRILASGGADGTVRLWNLDSGLCQSIFEGHKGGVRGVVLSGDGQLLASGGMDRTVRLWEVDTGVCIAVLQGHTAGIWDVALTPDGQLLASASYDGTIRLWEPDSRVSRAILQGHNGTIRSVALSADGKVVASGNFGGTIRLWDTEQGVCWLTLQGHVGMIFAVALTADLRTLASSGHDEMIRLWDTSNGKLLSTLQGHVDAATGVAFSDDGQLLASGGRDGTIRLWDLESGTSLAILQAERAGLRDMELLGDGRLLVSGSLDGVIGLWDVPGRRSLFALPAHTGMIWEVAISADGRRMASAGEDGIVRIWDTENGNCLATLTGHQGAVYSVGLTSDGRLAVSGGQDGTIRLWDIQNKTYLRVLERKGVVWNVALSPDGRRAVSGEHDGTVALWDINTGSLIRELRPDRPYERMDITGLTGITEAQKATLKALGAVESPLG
jgi:WD40 repeat protein/transcriptional regulator with XRE-family HTH domain